MSFGSPLHAAMAWPSVAAIAVAAALCWHARWLAIRQQDRLRQKLWPVLPALFALFLGLAGWMNYQFAPIGYELNETLFQVRMRGCRKSIALAAIRGAQVDRERRYAKAYSPWRYFSYPAFLYSGPWGLLSEGTFSGLGFVRAYVTDPARAVVLDTQPVTIITPDRPEEFVAALEQALKPYQVPAPPS